MKEGVSFSSMLKTFKNLHICSHLAYDKYNTMLHWGKSGFLKN